MIILMVIVFGIATAIWGPIAGIAVVVCGLLFCQPKRT